MSATQDYIKVLTELKPGNLGLLRTHSGKGIDESVDAFDLFAGLWWPLRQKNQKAPRRKVAWLIAKLYAFCPLEYAPSKTLMAQIKLCQPYEAQAKKRFIQRIDKLLTLSIDEIETSLQWALLELSSESLKLDWVKFTDDLSIWERESKRIEWANEYLYNKIQNINKENQSC